MAMTDSDLILNFLKREYTNEHPVIYLLISGKNKSSYATAINSIHTLTKAIFHNSCKEEVIKHTVQDFIELKQCEYITGKLKTRAIY